MTSHRATLLALLALASTPVLSGCKDKPQEEPKTSALDQLHAMTNDKAPVVTRELLERYAKYREAYAEIVADVRKREQARLAAAKDAAATGAVQAAESMRKSVEELAEAARAKAGLTREEVDACRALVSVVVTSGVVIEGKLEALEKELANAGPEAKKQLEESIALYREQRERLKERISAAKKSHGEDAIELIDDLRDVLAAAEKKVVEAARP